MAVEKSYGVQECDASKDANSANARPIKPNFMKCKLLFFFILIALFTHAQTKIVDSIRQQIFAAKNNQQKLAAILAYCDQYQSLNRDTAYNYALLAIELAKQTNDKRSLARAKLAFANSYQLWGWVDSAVAVCDSALKKYTVADADIRDIYFKLLRQKAISYGGVERVPEALDILYKLLREAEQYKDSVTIAYTCNTIGSVNINMSKPDEALRWVFRAMRYDTKDERFVAARGIIYANAAYAYMNNGKDDSATYFINEALPLCRKSQNLNAMAAALRIRSTLYTGFKKYDEAEADLREMIGIRQKLANDSNISDENIQIANFYASTGRLEKAIDFCLQHIKEGNIYNTKDTVSFTNHLSIKLSYYDALAGFYKQAGKDKQYAATLETILAAKDSLNTYSSALALAEVQTKYETEQKEKTILLQEYDLTKKNFIIYGSLVLTMLAGFIFYLLFREYRRRQKIKMELAMEHEKIAKQIAVKEAEEKERKRIAADLHDNLGVQANAILYNTELLKGENESNEKLVDDLHDTAKQMLLNLRETLWAMKTTDIAAAELWIRIINFSKQMGRHYTQIHFETQGAAPQDKHLPSARALNIVMMIQEAVQNAVKHSNATQIIIASGIIGNEWHITVNDNGNGFEYENAFAKTDSHGLKNMLERAKASGVKLLINSNANSGTVVTLEIKCNK